MKEIDHWLKIRKENATETEVDKQGPAQLFYIT